ncbi:SNF1-related protein kinase regulatory subunit beta-2-like [Durio zibethinus]|uniref:SNF1-related protein kinase regulatory subunit beta-2-like n=1 Tax=Durio zibethinus TaxID=66656 RepID=A0A6P6A4B9_DURZI|nr:SNF1-related protein kinase regulatory subunit beta-2-like [Durio zibethinus]
MGSDGFWELNSCGCGYLTDWAVSFCLEVMGNASGREDGEGTSGAKNNGYEVDNEQSNSDPMLHSPPHSPNEAYQLPFLFPPQIPMFPWLRSAEMMQAQNDVLVQNPTHNEDLHSENNLLWECIDSRRALDLQIHEAPFPRPGQMMQIQNDPLVENTAYCEDLHQEEKRAVMIAWCFGGKKVAITGSWDNWRTIEPLHSLGKEFIIMKMLPSGVYHYYFIVDDVMTYDPNLPWEFDESGGAYNILDLQEFVPEAPESLSEFESPPSPISSYDNQSLNDDDFSKPPPELPPQLRTKLLDEQSFVIRSHGFSRRPSHTLLNHLYRQDGDDGQSVALCTTHRFLQKYVTVVLYKSLHR